MATFLHPIFSTLTACNTLNLKTLKIHYYVFPTLVHSGL